jgi:hypothetical protein
MNFWRSARTLRPVAPSPLTRSVFPADAQATIYKTAPSPMTSGRTRAQRWTLRFFERRSAPYIEPLMGWTGDDDPLAQVELSFPSAEAAIAYARRQGLPYTVQGLPAGGSKPRLVSDRHQAEGRSPVRDAAHGWNGSSRTPAPELGRHELISPTEAYPHPKQVLGDNALSPTRKRDILRQWALDAYRLESEHAKPDNQSHLHEVIDALLDLEEPQISVTSFSHLDRKAS